MARSEAQGQATGQAAGQARQARPITRHGMLQATEWAKQKRDETRERRDKGERGDRGERLQVGGVVCVVLSQHFPGLLPASAGSWLGPGLSTLHLMAVLPPPPRT